MSSLFVSRRVVSRNGQTGTDRNPRGLGERSIYAQSITITITVIIMMMIIIIIIIIIIKIIIICLTLLSPPE